MAQLFCYTIFCLKHIIDPKWLALSAATTKCNLQGLSMSRKHQPMNLGYFIFQIMQKARHPSYPIKSNLTIISLVHTLGFKTSSVDQKQSLRALQVQYKRPQSDSKSTNPHSTHRPETWDQKPIQPVNNLTISKLRGGNMGTGEPSLSSLQPLSISSSRWLWVKVSDLLNHVFPIELKLESKNSLSLETFSQFWTLGVEIWVQGNLPSLPHNLSQFPLLGNCGSKFQTCYVFMLFLHFCY